MAGASANVNVPGRNCLVRFTQDKTRKQIIKNLIQSTKGDCTYYQWGRKDPSPGAKNFPADNVNKVIYPYAIGATNASWKIAQGGATGTGVAGAGKGINIVDGILHPEVFYVTSAVPNNWICTDTRDLWNQKCTSTTEDDIDLLMVKTVYDPSPAGYCVPNSYTFENLEGNDGTWADGFGWHGSFFPAAGCRFYTDGVIQFTTWGLYWSSCPHINGESQGMQDAMRFNFRETPQGVARYAVRRSDAYTIRAVKE